MVELCKLNALAVSASRKFPMSTDICLYLEEPWPECYIALANPLDENGAGKCIGYLRCVLVAHNGEPCSDVLLSKTVYIFAIVEVCPVLSPAPSIVVPLSGVLWSRPAAIEAHQSISVYQRGLVQHD